MLLCPGPSLQEYHSFCWLIFLITLKKINNKKENKLLAKLIYPTFLGLQIYYIFCMKTYWNTDSILNLLQITSEFYISTFVVLIVSYITCRFWAIPIWDFMCLALWVYNLLPSNQKPLKVCTDAMLIPFRPRQPWQTLHIFSGPKIKWCYSCYHLTCLFQDAN